MMMVDAVSELKERRREKQEERIDRRRQRKGYVGR